MNRPLYDGHARDLKPDECPKNGHRGLWYDRFFNRYDPKWSVESAGAKLKWVQMVKGKCGDATDIGRYAVAQRQLAGVLKGQTREFTTDWNFATGLGNPHPVENGFAWHPTLGTPYIAGSAVKGLVRAWTEGGWNETFPEDGAERRKHLHRWFGSESKDPADCETHITQTGGLIFFDAIPVEPPTLGADVMTPHMGKWYESGGSIEDIGMDNDKIPADWHDPVPVPFLVVRQATFLFAIAARHPKFQADVAPAMAALKSALAYLGAGAKTAVGYGYMRLPTKEEIVRQEQDRAERAAVALRCEWVDNAIKDIAKKNNAKPDEVLRGKALAEAWKGLTDAVLKGRVLADIRARWVNKGWWDRPPGGAAKKAREIYGSGS